MKAILNHINSSSTTTIESLDPTSVSRSFLNVKTRLNRLSFSCYLALLLYVPLEHIIDNPFRQLEI